MASHYFSTKSVLNERGSARSNFIEGNELNERGSARSNFSNGFESNERGSSQLNFSTEFKLNNKGITLLNFLKSNEVTDRGSALSGFSGDTKYTQYKKSRSNTSVSSNADGQSRNIPSSIDPHSRNHMVQIVNNNPHHDLNVHTNTLLRALIFCTGPAYESTDVTRLKLLVDGIKKLDEIISFIKAPGTITEVDSPLDLSKPKLSCDPVQHPGYAPPQGEVQLEVATSPQIMEYIGQPQYITKVYQQNSY
jgi:hypothetical protein